MKSFTRAGADVEINVDKRAKRWQFRCSGESVVQFHSPPYFAQVVYNTRPIWYFFSCCPGQDNTQDNT